MSKSLIALLGLSSIVLAWCSLTGLSDDSDAPVVQTGNTIAVDYIGTLSDGTIFDTSIASVAKTTPKYLSGRNYEPLTFTVGAGQMIPGFDKAVVGMKLNETKDITILPEDAYGLPKPDYLITTGVAIFSGLWKNPVIGEQYYFGLPQPGKVTKLESGQVTIDFNHELAGQTLKFNITIKKIGTGTVTQ